MNAKTWLFHSLVSSPPGSFQCSSPTTVRNRLDIFSPPQQPLLPPCLPYSSTPTPRHGQESIKERYWLMCGQQCHSMRTGLRDRDYSLTSLPRPRVCCNMGYYLCSGKLSQCMNLFTAMDIGSHESMKVLQKKVGHVSTTTVQNRMSLVLLLLKGTDTHFSFGSIFFPPSKSGIQYPLSFCVESFEDAIDFRAFRFFCFLNNLSFISNLAIGTDA